MPIKSVKQNFKSILQINKQLLLSEKDTIGIKYKNKASWIATAQYFTIIRKNKCMQYELFFSEKSNLKYENGTII